MGRDAWGAGSIFRLPFEVAAARAGQPLASELDFKSALKATASQNLVGINRNPGDIDRPADGAENAFTRDPHHASRCLLGVESLAVRRCDFLDGSLTEPFGGQRFALWMDDPPRFWRRAC